MAHAVEPVHDKANPATKRSVSAGPPVFIALGDMLVPIPQAVIGANLTRRCLRILGTRRMGGRCAMVKRLMRLALLLSTPLGVAMKNTHFGLSGRVAVVTGGYGVLGGSMATGLAAAGARVAVLGRRRAAGAEKADALRAEGCDAMALEADVLDGDALHAA